MGKRSEDSFDEADIFGFELNDAPEEEQEKFTEETSKTDSAPLVDSRQPKLQAEEGSMLSQSAPAMGNWGEKFAKHKGVSEADLLGTSYTTCMGIQALLEQQKPVSSKPLINPEIGEGKVI